MAPELEQCHLHGQQIAKPSYNPFESDIYSLGLVFKEILGITKFADSKSQLLFENLTNQMLEKLTDARISLESAKNKV